MNGYVYILESFRNGKYYIGSSKNYKVRLIQHNAGKVKSTKYNRPYKLVFYQQFKDIKTANRIERKLKSWKRKDYIKKIICDKIIKITGW